MERKNVDREDKSSNRKNNTTYEEANGGKDTKFQYLARDQDNDESQGVIMSSKKLIQQIEKKKSKRGQGNSLLSQKKDKDKMLIKSTIAEDYYPNNEQKEGYYAVVQSLYKKQKKKEKRGSKFKAFYSEQENQSIDSYTQDQVQNQKQNINRNRDRDRENKESTLKQLFLKESIQENNRKFKFNDSGNKKKRQIKNYQEYKFEKGQKKAEQSVSSFSSNQSMTKEGGKKKKKLEIDEQILTELSYNVDKDIQNYKKANHDLLQNINPEIYTIKQQSIQQREIANKKVRENESFYSFREDENFEIPIQEQDQIQQNSKRNKVYEDYGTNICQQKISNILCDIKRRVELSSVIIQPNDYQHQRQDNNQKQVDSRFRKQSFDRIQMINKTLGSIKFKKQATKPSVNKGKLPNTCLKFDCWGKKSLVGGIWKCGSTTTLNRNDFLNSPTKLTKCCEKMNENKSNFLQKYKGFNSIKISEKAKNDICLSIKGPKMNKRARDYQCFSEVDWAQIKKARNEALQNLKY